MPVSLVLMAMLAPVAAPPHVDALGDPLPTEAIARLGTVRFRHGSNIYELAFTPDGKQIVAFGHDAVRTWDAATGKEVGRVPIDAGISHGGALSRDGQRIFLLNRSDKGSVLHIHQRAKGKQETALDLGQTHSFRLSPHGKVERGRVGVVLLDGKVAVGVSCASLTNSSKGFAIIALVLNTSKVDNSRMGVAHQEVKNEPSQQQRHDCQKVLDRSADATSRLENGWEGTLVRRISSID